MKARIVFLGTSSGVPTAERNHPSVFVEFGGRRLLFDCGEGTQRQMMRAGLSLYKTDAVFLSHLHADHWLGIGGLYATAKFFGRREPLLVLGPRGIRDICGFFAPNKKSRLTIKTHDLRTGVAYDGGTFIVRAFPLEHGIPCYGFVLEEKCGTRLDKTKLRRYGLLNNPLCRELKEKGRVRVGTKTVTMAQVSSSKASGFKLCYITDSRPTARITKECAGADVLVCESTFAEDRMREARDYGHMTAREAATLAGKARAKRLFLVHFSPRYKDPGVLEKEARAIFPQARAARDLMEVKV
ncbi:ribonuclease Z [Candidatus Micrarchaeota archaeon]|nr:ribonuclease Z [Candidatus Micrarchaeota archaeon]